MRHAKLGEAKFAVIMYQAGEGCDYTIDCGVRVEPLKTHDPKAAAAEASRLLLGNPEEGETCWLQGEGDDCALERATLVAVVGDLPVASLFAGLQAVKHARTTIVTEDMERAEYERLRAKYGPQPTWGG